MFWCSIFTLSNNNNMVISQPQKTINHIITQSGRGTQNVMENKFEVRYTLFQNNWTSFDESDYFDTEEEAIECANNNDTLEYYTDGNNSWYCNGRQCQVFNSAGESIYIAPGVDTTCYGDQEGDQWVL